MSDLWFSHYPSGYTESLSYWPTYIVLQVLREREEAEKQAAADTEPPPEQVVP